MQKNLTFDETEDFAFYESGLSSDGCLQNLDEYAKQCILRYGRMLLANQKQQFINGFSGCCYTCEPVGIMNQELAKAANQLYEVVLVLTQNNETFLTAQVKQQIEDALSFYKNVALRIS